MAVLFDDAAAIHAILAALPCVRATAAAELCYAQMGTLPARTATTLTATVVRALAAEAWTDAIDGRQLASWPAEARAELLRAIRGLPPGATRSQAFCRAAEWLEEHDHREAFEAIVNGVLSDLYWVTIAELNDRSDGVFEELLKESPDGRKPVHYGDLHTQLLKAVPAAWREEFVTRRLAKNPSESTRLSDEIHIRREIDCWPEAAVRRIWAGLGARNPGARCLALDAFFVLRKLPEDLSVQALARIRACEDARERLHYLSTCDDDDLTAAEHADIADSGSPYLDARPWDIANHLDRVSRHLVRLPYSVRLRWLDKARGWSDPHARAKALDVLAPMLEPPERAAALGELVQLTLASEASDGLFPLWHATEVLMPEDIAVLLDAAVQRGRSNSTRERMLTRLSRLPDDAQDTCLAPLFYRLGDIAPRTRIGLATDAAWWASSRSAGALPVALARHLEADSAPLRKTKPPDPKLGWEDYG
jgi:hypothetical protein